MRKFVLPFVGRRGHGDRRRRIGRFPSHRKSSRSAFSPRPHPVYIAREMGLLAEIEKKYNVTFEWPVFSYGAPENQALAAGENPARFCRHGAPPSSPPPVCPPS